MSIDLIIFRSNELTKGNKDKIRVCFIAIVINHCCFKVDLFTRLDNIFPC